VIAFVAEFSRGKSELINAIFFADAGRRVLPATPGRTTMCPVELSWDEHELPTLDLLPIDTRREAASLADWRAQRERWKRLSLDPSDTLGLARSLNEVTAIGCQRRRRCPCPVEWHQPTDNRRCRPMAASRCSLAPRHHQLRCCGRAHHRRHRA
jgi:hypothetical protein